MPPVVGFLASAAFTNLVGLGLGVFAMSQLGKMSGGGMDMSAMTALQSQNSNTAQEAESIVNEMPEAPAAPAEAVAADPNAEAANPEAQDAANQVLEEAALAETEYNPSGGLGLTGTAPGKAKGLGGA